MSSPKPAYIYIAFDLFPSQKGAATHINHCLKALQNTFDVGVLICLGNDDMPAVQFDKERNIFVYRFKEKVLNFLERTTKFKVFVAKIIALPVCEQIQLVHFRDIWGGIPVLTSGKSFKTVFEVNSFASIELPSRYPQITQNTLHKIAELEQQCITKSSAIITPSLITKNYIVSRFNISEAVITHIHNGVEIYPATKNKNVEKYILYFGALQKWQGIKTLFKAYKELVDLDLKLIICTSIPEKRVLPFKELATQIGVEKYIEWQYELSKVELAQVIINAQCTIAPLSACNRNLIQGCNPLKIIESMAYGVPVIASNLPVCIDIITNNVNGFLVPPDRPEILGRTIRTLLSDSEKITEIGNSAKKTIEDSYLWEYQESKMKTIYLQLLN